MDVVGLAQKTGQILFEHQEEAILVLLKVLWGNPETSENQILEIEGTQASLESYKF